HGRLQNDLPHTYSPGEHQRLPRHMPTERDCHPVDVIRPALPGYSGFLPGRKLAA
ncbi:MTERFD1, partial [Symbiodinium sp. CCMP2592]